ncbi:MAG: hypothetical protein EZS28_030320 [Streblomastix strix]|uniref:DDE-1 domain-containing protein n=1 Tax=Streblomastix strix TaxID=222440 RepID=A0A5J4UUX8_9EUKA|nr:MAG: hypothetical protein EZS28_030320 [Streblomastix strix]
MNNQREQGQKGGKRLLVIGEELKIYKIFEDKIQLHDFPTCYDAIDIVKSVINLNPLRADIAQKIDIEWLERFCNYHKQFKLLRGHIVDKKRFWACTREMLASWYEKITKLRYDHQYKDRNIWNGDEVGMNLTPRRCNKPNTTLMFMVSYAGNALKSDIIINSKTVQEEFDELDSNLFRVIANQRGWQTGVTFENYMREVGIKDGHVSRMNQKPLDCGVNARLKQRMAQVFRYPTSGGAAAFRRNLIEALKTSVQQALDSENIKLKKENFQFPNKFTLVKIQTNISGEIVTSNAFQLKWFDFDDNKMQKLIAKIEKKRERLMKKQIKKNENKKIKPGRKRRQIIQDEDEISDETENENYDINYESEDDSLSGYDGSEDILGWDDFEPEFQQDIENIKQKDENDYEYLFPSQINEKEKETDNNTHYQKKENKTESDEIEDTVATRRERRSKTSIPIRYINDDLQIVAMKRKRNESNINNVNNDSQSRQNDNKIEKNDDS